MYVLSVTGFSISLKWFYNMSEVTTQTLLMVSCDILIYRLRWEIMVCWKNINLTFSTLPGGLLQFAKWCESNQERTVSISERHYYCALKPSFVSRERNEKSLEWFIYWMEGDISTTARVLCFVLGRIFFYLKASYRFGFGFIVLWSRLTNMQSCIIFIGPICAILF